jgi:MFS family permease
MPVGCHFILVAGTVATAGAGIGTLFPIATVSVQNAVEPANLGIATATLTFLRPLGGAIGVAALGAVFLGHGVMIQSIGARHEPSAGPKIDFALRHAFVLVFGLAAAALVASQICLIVIREKPWRLGHDSMPLGPEKPRSR